MPPSFPASVFAIEPPATPPNLSQTKPSSRHNGRQPRSLRVSAASWNRDLGLNTPYSWEMLPHDDKDRERHNSKSRREA